MFRNANNNFFAFVCNHSDTDVNAIAGNVLEASAIANGDVVLVTRDNEILPDSNQTGVAGLKFKIATKAGGKLFYSPLLELSGTTIGSGNNVAATNQVTVIGSNGTTGVLLDPAIIDTTTAAAAVGNSYYVLIEKQDNDEANRSGYRADITAQVKLTDPNNAAGTDAELLQVRLAELLREAIRKNDQLEVCGSAGAARYISVKAVNNGGSLVAPAAAGTVAVTFGSPTVTLTGSTWAAGIAAGDFLNIAGDTYRIKEKVSTTVLTLDFPFAGTTASALDATDTAEIAYQESSTIQGATGVGLEITGTSQHDFDVNRERKWSVSRFNVRFAKDGEGVGTVVTTTAANEGLGEWQQVAMEEYESFGALGQRWVSDIPAALRDKNTVEGAVYGLISLREVTTKQNALIGQTLGKTTYHIWLELQSGVVDGANSPQDVLLTQLNVSASAVQ